MALKVFVQTLNETSWHTNGLEFDTQDEAVAYANDLYGRWLLTKRMAVLEDPGVSHLETMGEDKVVIG